MGYVQEALLPGRSRELETLSHGVAELRAGRGSLVLIVGEPGIGKTRLAEEAARSAGSSGVRVVWGAAWDGGDAPAYWPWIQVLRALRSELPPPSAALRRDLGPLFDDGREAGSRVDDFRLWDALRAMLDSASRSAPLLVVLDDLHAADRETLRALEFVAKSLRTLPLMIVGTHRDAAVRLRTDTEALLARVARMGLTLELGGLDRAAIRSLVGGLDPVSETTLDEITRRSNGNPLFAGEIVRLLRRGIAAERVPDGVRAVLADRLRDLELLSRQLLEMAAILGRETTLGTLARLAGAPVDVVEGRLARAHLAGLVEKVAPDRIVFAHPLFRETLHDGLDADQRCELHRRAAVAVEESSSPGAPLEASVARHLLLALPKGSVETAVQKAVAAAKLCRRTLALERAVELLERAAAVLTAPGHELLRLDVALELAETLPLVGQAERGRALAADAARRAEALGDGPRVARAALAYGTELRVSVVDPKQLELVDVALRLTGEHDLALRAKLLARRAAAEQPSTDPERTARDAFAAVELARRAGDASTLVTVLHLAGAALTGYAPPAERRPLSRELAQLATAEQELALAQRGYTRWAIDASELGDTEEMHAAIRAAERLGQTLGHARFRWQPALLQSMAALIEGRWSDSEAAIAEAEKLVGELEDPAASYSLVIHRVSALGARCQEDVDDLRLAELFSGPPGRRPEAHAMAKLVRADALGRSGDAATAHRLLDTLVPVPPYMLLIPPIAALVLDAAAWAGHRALVLQTLPLVERLSYPALSWGHTGFVWTGFTGEPLGRAYALLGRTEQAVESLTDAVDRAELFGARPTLVFLRLSLASALLARAGEQDRKLAARHLDEAESEARALEMTLALAPLARARARFDAESAPAVTRGVAGAEAPVPSLVREGEIWTLGYAGKTTRLKHSRALEILKELVDQPGREIHVLDFGKATEPGEAVDLGDAGGLLDAAARAAYGERASELREELEQAERWNDAARLGRARAELEFLEDELGRATALGGRVRRSAGAAERARVNVHKRLRGLIGRIGESLPELGTHLELSVKTGFFVAYRPSR